MDTQCTSLRWPSEPSALTRNFGTRNSEMPFTPRGASGMMRASTRWIAAVALRFGARAQQARSEPACGSVRFMVPVHLPEIIGPM